MKKFRFIKTENGSILKDGDFTGSYFSQNIITDNKTKKNGNVVNKRSDNAAFARKWVDDNHL